MAYKLQKNAILQNEKVIPLDINNADYREYLAWLEAGNTLDPADPDLDVSSLIVDSTVIIGNGVDEINLIVQGKPNALIPLDVLTGNTPSTVNVQLNESGNGSQTFSCETSPTVIVFSYGDISAKVRAL